MLSKTSDQPNAADGVRTVKKMILPLSAATAVCERRFPFARHARIKSVGTRVARSNSAKINGSGTDLTVSDFLKSTLAYSKFNR
jgi:hypothetical protein